MTPLSELAKRIFFAVPAAAVLLYITWLGGWAFQIFMAILGLFLIKETSALFERADLYPDTYFPYSFGLWILLSPILPHPLQIGMAIFVLFILVQLFNSTERTLRSSAATIFSGLYAPVGILAFILIRSQSNTEDGFMLALGLLLMVWGNDIFAYFGGKGLGKHLMAPVVSPKKTWEGFGFGFLGALAGISIALYLVPLEMPGTFLQLVPAVILVSVLGPVGDLSVSKIKRAVDVKDTSDILPGHGGFLDRFDALILAAPAFYLYYYLLQILGHVPF